MPTQLHTSPRLLSLLDRASMRAGNDNKLAKMLSTTRHAISAYRAGRRSCPIEDQALMAAVVGDDPLTEIAVALIERNADTPRGEKLVSALGKGLMASTGAIPFILSGNDALASNIPVGVELLRCIFRAFL